MNPLVQPIDPDPPKSPLVRGTLNVYVNGSVKLWFSISALNFRSPLTKGARGIRSIFTTLLTILLFSSPTIARDRFQDLKDPDYWIQLCTTLSKTKPAEALSACERAIELRSGDAELWANYGGLQFKLKQYPDAIVAFTQALKRQPENSQVLTQQCMTFKELNQIQPALVGCEQALKINKKWGDILPSTAQHYRTLLVNKPEGYEAAIQFYETVLKKEPTNLLTLLYRGQAMEKLEKPPEQILESYKQALARTQWEPENLDVLQTRSQLQRNAGEFELAVQSLDRALYLQPNDASIWFQLGTILTQLDRPTEALTAFNRTLELQPNGAITFLNQCKLLNQLRQAEPALAACQKAMQGDQTWGKPDISQILNQKSHALTTLNKLEEALADANRVIGMRPDWNDAWTDRAVVLWHLKRYPEALESVQKALVLNPEDARSWANQGRILRSLNQPQTALTAYNESLKRDPKNAITLANLSAVQWSLGCHPEALISANQAIALNPKLVQGWQNRALALIALKNFPDAQTSYERSVQLDPTNADAWTGLGLVLAQLQQYPEALQALQKAISLNANQTVAQQAIAAIQEAQKPTVPTPTKK